MDWNQDTIDASLPIQLETLVLTKTQKGYVGQAGLLHLLQIDYMRIDRALISGWFSGASKNSPLLWNPLIAEMYPMAMGFSGI